MAEISQGGEPIDRSQIDEALAPIREQIDLTDFAILVLMRRRLELSMQVAEIKRPLGESPVQHARRRKVIESRSEWGQAIGLDPEFVGGMFEALVSNGEAVQRELLSTEESAAPQRVATSHDWDVIF